jgi:hypothetical protein
MIPWIPEAMAAAGMAAGSIAGALCVWLHRRGQALWRRETAELRADCLAQMARVEKEIEEWRRESQASAEFCEVRLSAPARSRALRMIRAGIAPETAAAELGMARSEVELLREVAGALGLPQRC